MAQPLNQANQSVRAETYEEIRPLVELCRAGKLFEVQSWIASGKPVNGPKPTRRQHPRSPLKVTVERGFHSLVKVLLAAGAIDDGEGQEALIYRALRDRRFDLVELFVANGFDPSTIDMVEVLKSWDPAIMQYFVDRGASLEKGLPLAQAFCSKVGTALKIYKSHRDKIPALQEQANIALRHHARAGNLKWISLMLWVGADPYAPGVTEVGDFDPDHQDGDDGLSALGWAGAERVEAANRLSSALLGGNDHAPQESDLRRRTQKPESGKPTHRGSHPL